MCWSTLLLLLPPPPSIRLPEVRRSQTAGGRWFPAQLLGRSGVERRARVSNALLNSCPQLQTILAPPYLQYQCGDISVANCSPWWNLISRLISLACARGPEPGRHAIDIHWINRQMKKQAQRSNPATAHRVISPWNQEWSCEMFYFTFIFSGYSSPRKACVYDSFLPQNKLRTSWESSLSWCRQVQRLGWHSPLFTQAAWCSVLWEPLT